MAVKSWPILSFLMFSIILASQPSEGLAASQPSLLKVANRKPSSELNTLPFWSELPEELPTVQMIATESFGKIPKGASLRTKSEWIWKFDKQSKIEQLYLRVKAHIPSGIKAEIAPQDLIKKYDADDRQMVIDFIYMPNTVSLNLTDTNAPESPSKTVVFNVSTNTPGPFFAVHKTCSDLNMGIKTMKEMTGTFWASVYCHERDKTNGIAYFFVTSPYRVEAIGANTRSDPGRNLATFIFNKNSPNVIFRIIEDSGVTSGEYYLSMNMSEESSFRLGMSLGASFTYLTYQELGHGIDISEMGLTLKYGLRLPIISHKMDIDGSIFGFLTPSSSDSTIPAAQFVGVNGRIGYKLPESWFNLNWHTYLGAYGWKMFVPNNAYGLSFLSGPQAFLSVRSDRLARRQVYTYLKYALIFNTDGTLNAGTREIAIGGGVQVGKLMRRPLLITLDIAQMGFVAADSLNNFNMLSTSLGTSISF